MGMIHEALAAIATEVPSIEKSRNNQQQGFKYRGIDDVYAAIHPLFSKHGVFSVPVVEAERSEERTTKNGGALIYRILTVRYDFFAKDGSFVSAKVIGEGMDSGDKASNKALAVAHKYALLQILSIPIEDSIDPDAESPEVAPRRPAVQNAPATSDKHPSGGPASFAEFVALIESTVPAPEQVEWKRKANGGRDLALLSTLAVEIKARYTGKLA